MNQLESNTDITKVILLVDENKLVKHKERSNIYEFVKANYSLSQSKLISQSWT